MNHCKPTFAAPVYFPYIISIYIFLSWLPSFIYTHTLPLSIRDHRLISLKI